MLEGSLKHGAIGVIETSMAKQLKRVVAGVER